MQKDVMLRYIGKNKDFNVFEQGVDQDVMEFFHEFKDSLSDEELEISDVDIDIEELQDDAVSEDFKKLLLVRLSSTDDIKAFRALQKFSSESAGELQKWSVVALQQSMAFVEASLSDEERVFIVSGLGGLGDKLRYFSILNTPEKEKLSDWQIKIIKDELFFSAEMAKGDIEELNVFDSFVSVLCLLPVDKSISEFFKTTVDNINEMGQFLSENVLVTNTKKFTEEQILEYIDEGPEALFGDDIYPNEISLD
ncbi:MAG: hypothetical protein U9N85_01585 [Bacteroidota bacterium]|nr:hypothetical protein [Bacteroidota bacterium]